MGDEGGKDNPRKELSLDSARKIIDDIAKTPTGQALARRTKFEEYIGPLERKAFKIVVKNIARQKDRTEQFASSKTDGQLRLTVRLADHHGIPYETSMSLVRGNFLLADFSMPMLQGAASLETPKVSFDFTHLQPNSAIIAPHDQPIGKDGLALLFAGVKWLATNLSRWTEKDIVIPEIS